MTLSNIISAALLLTTFSFTSCKSLFGVQTATNFGLTGGEAVGEIVGKASGNAGAGAIIGASLGEVTGSVIGLKMDKQAAEIQKGISNSKVIRAGDGITIELNNDILFESNKSDLSQSAQSNLNELAGIFKKYPDTKLEVQGHTDNKGKAERNKSLSEKRASTVASYLEAKGVDNNRISVKGLGDTIPKYDNTSDKGRLLNRRVEIVISEK